MKKLKKDATKVFNAIKDCKGTIYLAGNGGSASLANHLECDWAKSSRFKLSVRSLVSNPSVLTMIANDYGYEHIINHQLTAQRNRYVEDILVLISSSGSSPNILRAAIDFDETSNLIGFTGFKGGELKQYCNTHVHIDSVDYGEIEDYHSNVMHEVSRMLKEYYR